MGTGHEFVCYKSQTRGVSLGVSGAHTHEVLSLSERISVVQGHWPVPFVNGSRPTAEDHPVTRGDEGSITAVELAAMHPELTVDHCLRLITSRWEILAFVCLGKVVTVRKCGDLWWWCAGGTGDVVVTPGS